MKSPHLYICTLYKYCNYTDNNLPSDCLITDFHSYGKIVVFLIFFFQVRTHPDRILSTPGVKNDTEMAENINNNDEKSTVINIQTDNLIFGHNNVINTVMDPAVKREIEAMFESRERKSIK